MNGIGVAATAGRERGEEPTERSPLFKWPSPPLLAVLISKDVDVARELRLGQLGRTGALKGVEGINGPPVQPRPHLDHAARHQDQARLASPEPNTLSRRTPFFAAPA